MGEGPAIFKEMGRLPANAEVGAHPCVRPYGKLNESRFRAEATGAHTQVRSYRCGPMPPTEGYCSDVRGCRVLDSAKKVSMTLRAAGRSVQRFTRVDK
jgi:hypothetical protein